MDHTSFLIRPAAPIAACYATGFRVHKVFDPVLNCRNSLNSAAGAGTHVISQNVMSSIRAATRKSIQELVNYSNYIDQFLQILTPR